MAATQGQSVQLSWAMLRGEDLSRVHEKSVKGFRLMGHVIGFLFRRDPRAEVCQMDRTGKGANLEQEA